MARCYVSPVIGEWCINLFDFVVFCRCCVDS